MKVRKLLEIQSKFEEAVIPSDMDNDELEKHYSESKDKEINILDMDLIHLVRSYSKCIRKNNLTDKIIIYGLVREPLFLLLSCSHADLKQE